MSGKQGLSLVLAVFFLGVLVGCSGIGRAATNLEDAGYRLEENEQFLDGLDDDALDRIQTAYIIFDENDAIVGSLVEFNSKKDMYNYFELYGTEEEIKEIEDNLYRNIFIIAPKTIIDIIKD